MNRFLAYSKKLLVALALFLALPASVFATTQTSSLKGSFSALGQTVYFQSSAPTNGGTLSGDFTGACSGTINGNFTAGTNAISGSINGQCSIVGFEQQFILNYQGSIDAGDRKLIINNISHIDNSSSIVTDFITLPVSTDININTLLDQVSTGTTYTDPQNTDVRVFFNSLPGTPGSLSFSQTTLTPAEILNLHAINGTAYQLVSSMTDGSFTYDLTLPVANSINLSTLIIRYGSALNVLNNIVSQSIILNGDNTATIQGLDHFTYFVATVVIPQPSVSFTNPINNANKNNVTISGTGLANGNINYTFTDAGSAHSVSGTGIVASDGSINITGIDLSSLNDGAINLSVTVDDGLGNVSDPGTSSSSKDTVLPNLPIVSINNPINLGNRTNISLDGTGEAGITFNWSITDGVQTISGSGTVSGLGTFFVSSIDLSSLNDGSIQVTVVLADSAGNTSTAGLYSATKDTSIPSLISSTLSSSNANALFAKVTDLISLLMNFSESVQIPTVTIAGHNVTPVNTSLNNWLAIYSMLGTDTEGLILYTINYSDLAGNAGSGVSTSSGITFDMTQPTLTVTSVSSSNVNPNFAKVGDTITLDFVSSETIQAPTVTIAGQNVVAVNTVGNTWIATYVMIGTDTEGAINYTIAFQDLASNFGASVNTSTAITFDKTNPTITSTTVTTNNSNALFARVGDVITLNFTSDENIQTPLVTIAGHAVTATNIGGNSWEATWIMTVADTEGLIPYTLSFQDLAGNAGINVNVNSTITFDQTVPLISGVTLTNNTTGNSGFVKNGDTITLTAIITDNNQALLIASMITADLSSFGGGVAINPVSYNNLTGLATWAPLVVSGFGNATLSITVNALDIANNPATAQNVSTITDNIAPVTIDNTSIVWFNSSVTITLTCSDNNGCAQTFYTTDESTPTLTSNTGGTVVLSSSGIFTIRYFSIDLAGNPGLVMTALNQVKVDIDAPTGSWVSPNLGFNPSVIGIVNVSTVYSDNLSSIASAQLFFKRNDDGVDTFHLILGSTWDTTDLALDTYTLRLVLVDVAGNVANIDQNIDVATVISPIAAVGHSYTSAKITWITDDPGTSRVIYDTTSHPILSAGPDFGYAFSSPEFDLGKVLNHVVLIEGLKSGTTYYFRMVTKGSPTSLSEEKTLTTLSVAGPPSQTSSTQVKVEQKKQDSEINFGIPTAYAAEYRPIEASVSGEATEGGKGAVEEPKENQTGIVRNKTILAVIIALTFGAFLYFKFIRK